MRVVTWNCNGALRNKWEKLAALDTDIAVIQECEDPKQARASAYRAWAANHLWVGPSKNRGLGIFAAPALALKLMPLDLQPLELFLPCVVDGDWPLLAVWTRDPKSSNFGYIGQLWTVLQKEREFLRHPGAMAIGDLNSNTIWDRRSRCWNHSDVTRELSELGLESCYHRHFSEAPGAESRSTFFLQRNLAKSFHIDYGFAGPTWELKNVVVGTAKDWLEHSDHMPVVFDFERCATKQ
jgi:hypothetical protein